MISMDAGKSIVNFVKIVQIAKWLVDQQHMFVIAFMRFMKVMKMIMIKDINHNKRIVSIHSIIQLFIISMTHNLNGRTDVLYTTSSIPG